MKQKRPPTKELKELHGLAADGKISNRIQMALRKQKKAGAVNIGAIVASHFMWRNDAYGSTISGSNSSGHK